MARVALRRGAQVTLISGPTRLAPPRGARFFPVTSAQQMYQAVMENLREATVVVKSAAVVDHRPARFEKEKIKKTEGGLMLPLEPTPDILAEVGAQKGDRLLIGFAAETSDLIANAKEKLQRKNLDWIVANDLTKPGAGFETDTNEVTILHRDGAMEPLPKMDKEEVAWAILDRVARHRQEAKGP